MDKTLLVTSVGTVTSVTSSPRPSWLFSAITMVFVKGKKKAESQDETSLLLPG